MGIEILGWIGFGILVMAWVPQTWDTIRDGYCSTNLVFIILYAVASLLLTIYAILQNDYVFTALNALLTIGSGINMFYKLFPRNPQHQ
ncbi:MAG: hypothetical protein JXR26_04265 [Balneolaceae bacterium]|nr:hypothetical protein [Balneolaceae bacterium]